MIWYFNTQQAYNYPDLQPIENPIKHFNQFDNDKPQESGLYYFLSYVKNNNIGNLTIVFSFDNLYVEYGTEGDININFCESQSIPYKYDNRKGGCMVLFPGNVVVQDIRLGHNYILAQELATDFILWLNQKEITNVKFIDNDILVDNKKIMGMVLQQLPAPFDDYIYFGIQITINSNIELINQICTKPMKKIPGALSDYGVSTLEMVDWLLEWFNRHQYTE